VITFLLLRLEGEAWPSHIWRQYRLLSPISSGDPHYGDGYGRQKSALSSGGRRAITRYASPTRSGRARLNRRRRRRSSGPES
jgi:hypothetical protein